MKIGTFILCEEARLRPDGTFDLRNGGLTESKHESFPARLSIAAVLILEAEPGESGPQQVDIHLRDAHARRLRLWPYRFELKPGQKGAHIVLNLKEAVLPAAGEYLFDVRLGAQTLGPSKTLRAALHKRR